MPQKPTYSRSFADGKPSPGARIEQTQAFLKPKPKTTLIQKNGRLVPVAAVLLPVPPVSAGPAAGAPGPAGAAGTNGGTGTYTAGMTLSGGMVVAVRSDGNAYYADSSTPADAWRTAGFTTGAASLGSAVIVQESGELTEPGWAWTPGLPVFLGSTGLPTQAAPASGFILIVGVALEPTVLLVRIEQAIILAV